MILNEKGDIALLECLTSTYTDNNDLREQVAQSTCISREKIKVSIPFSVSMVSHQAKVLGGQAEGT